MHAQRTTQKIIEPDFLLTAYCSGYFPMAESKNGEIGWYSPDPRGILELELFHITRSLMMALKKAPFEVVVDRHFESVMRECAARDETWISEEIVQSYLELHRRGYAHSVECIRNGELVGGLYGVAIGGAFFGESMFTQVKNASKVALVELVKRLRAHGYSLLDTEFVTPHLSRFGATEIPRSEYLKRLAAAIAKKCTFA